MPLVTQRDPEMAWTFCLGCPNRLAFCFQRPSLHVGQSNWLHRRLLSGAVFGDASILRPKLTWWSQGAMAKVVPKQTASSSTKSFPLLASCFLSVGDLNSNSRIMNQDCVYGKFQLVRHAQRRFDAIRPPPRAVPALSASTLLQRLSREHLLVFKRHVMMANVPQRTTKLSHDRNQTFDFAMF